jgi:hypothetical protein
MDRGDGRKVHIRSKVVEEYRSLKNMSAVAGSVGMSSAAVWKILQGEKEPSVHAFGEVNGPPYQKQATGCVARWIRKHPKERLPTDRYKVSRVTGCSIGAVGCYLSRRKKKAGNLPKELPDLREERIVLRSNRDEEPLYFGSGALDEYRVHIHPLTFVVFITGVLRTGEGVIVEIPLEALWRKILKGREERDERP